MNPSDYKSTVYKIIGAAMNVHRTLGWGLLEPIYNEALHMELLDNGIDNKPEMPLPCYYKNHLMKKSYKMDMVAGDIVIELKVAKDLISAHRAQLFNYLRLTKKPIGLLINFGQKSLQGERYAYIEATNECYLLDKNMNILHPKQAYEDE